MDENKGFGYVKNKDDEIRFTGVIESTIDVMKWENEAQVFQWLLFQKLRAMPKDKKLFLKDWKELYDNVEKEIKKEKD